MLEQGYQQETVGQGVQKKGSPMDTNVIPCHF